MRRLMLVLSVIAVVAVLLVSAAPAIAQDQTVEEEITIVKGKDLEDLPPSGGVTLGSSAVILPGVALLVGGALLMYSVVRRR